ncbi:uncharacterized protein LOC113983742 isoform X3 [Pipra filicauda]|nr:uncharacterized protein LOC113983742 isoform X3 [Pipra filicauda]
MGRSHLEQGHSHLPRYLGMSWEGATGSRDIPTFPAVSFPAMTWNIPLPASRGTRNPRDSIPGLSQPLGATQTPPGMFIIPGKAAPFPHPGRFPAGKAAPGTSFPLFLSRDRAPIPLGMRISCRYSGIFSLLGNFFPSKSWINPGFFWGMGSFRSSFFFWEEGIIFPAGKNLFLSLVREYPEGIVASRILRSTRIPFSLGINSRFPSPSWIKTRIGIRQGLEFWQVTPLGSPSRPIPWKTPPPHPKFRLQNSLFRCPFSPRGRRMIPFSRCCNSRNSEIPRPWEWFGGFSHSCCFSWEFGGGGVSWEFSGGFSCLFPGSFGADPALFASRDSRGWGWIFLH